MQGARNRPPQHDYREAAPRAHQVEQATASNVQRRIRKQERGLEIGKLLV